MIFWGDGWSIHFYTRNWLLCGPHKGQLCHGDSVHARFWLYEMLFQHQHLGLRYSWARLYVVFVYIYIILYMYIIYIIYISYHMYIYNYIVLFQMMTAVLFPVDDVGYSFGLAPWLVWPYWDRYNAKNLLNHDIRVSQLVFGFVSIIWLWFAKYHYRHVDHLCWNMLSYLISQFFGAWNMLSYLISQFFGALSDFELTPSNAHG